MLEFISDRLRDLSREVGSTKTASGTLQVRYRCIVLHTGTSLNDRKSKDILSISFLN